MSPINDQKIFRVLDANFNRAKEGLRVCEEVCRFVLDNASSARKYKTLRHRLTEVLDQRFLRKVIACRDIEGDVGKASLNPELKRVHTGDIFFANSQRVKESLRVIEEFVKLFNKEDALAVKHLRYQVYALEKKIMAEL